MNICLCCSEQLLRHIRQSSIYWFCPRCKQEMPGLEMINPQLAQKIPKVNLRKNPSSNPIRMTLK